MKYVFKIAVMGLGAYLGYIGIVSPGLDPGLYVCILGGALFGYGASIR